MIERELLPFSWSVVPLRRVLKKAERPVPDGSEIVTAYRSGRVTLRSATREEGYTLSEAETGYQGVERGDLVFHALDGFAGAVGVSDATGRCTPVYHVCEPVLGDDPRFIAYSLRAMGSTGFLAVQAGNVRQRSVDFRAWDAFAQIPFPRPPFSRQREIAGLLDAETARIDALVENKQRMIGLLRERFVSARRAAFDRLVSSSGDIALRRCVRCLDGRRIPLNAEDRAERLGPYPYWGAGTIVDYIDEFLFHEPLALLGEDGAPFFDDSRDVAYYVDDPVWVNNHIHVLRPLRGWSPRYLVHMLNAVDFSRYITGSTRDKLTQAE
ncbi:MAG TPA: restriction endonuclease subunit S, partial [Acidimicrobiales bacterium]|nr:restriction endonuclease subunit S [Acidimicrobiales bacterium]